jgi:hypothetical protein
MACLGETTVNDAHIITFSIFHANKYYYFAMKPMVGVANRSGWDALTLFRATRTEFYKPFRLKRFRATVRAAQQVA